MKNDLSADEVRNTLEDAAIPTKYSSSKTSKFSQYSDYASQLNSQRGGTVAGPGAGQSSNPYANVAPASGNPYGGTNQGYDQSYGQNPYEQAASSQQSYGQPAQSSYGQSSVSQQSYGGSSSNYQSSQPYARGSSPAPTYHTTASASPYATAESDYNQRYGGRLAPTATNDTALENSRNQLFGDARNRAPVQEQSQSDYRDTPNRAALFGAAVNGDKAGTPGYASKSSQSQPAGSANADDDDELLMTSNELEQRNRPSTGYDKSRFTNGGSGYNQGSSYGAGGGEYGQEREEIDSEDEDVEAIKTQMKYVKKETVNVARDALQSAARAEESGRNALGMLGAQGERISNTERSLALASTQNKIAEEKARELKTLNRSMFAVHVGNPFNSKRRLQEKEDQIRSDRRMEQLNNEDRRKAAYDSQQRVMGGMNGSLSQSATAQKYKTKNFKERSKYQMEADSEDEDLEDEIDRSVDALSHAAGRLNKLALTAHEEIKTQNERLGRISDDADKLDINVHLNTNRLMNIK